MMEDPATIAKPNVYDRAIEKLGLSFHPGSDEDSPIPEPEYFLVGHPRGVCPWCKTRLVEMLPRDVWAGRMFCARVDCHDYHTEETEDENRIRYAAEKLEDLKNDRS